MSATDASVYRCSDLITNNHHKGFNPKGASVSFAYCCNFIAGARLNTSASLAALILFKALAIASFF
jgi:hypothetical protein